jgi:hypothetical protein
MIDVNILLNTVVVIFDLCLIDYRKVRVWVGYPLIWNP